MANLGAELAADDMISAAYDRRATGRLVKHLDEGRKGAVEQLKHAIYFHRQAVWLQDRFPKAELKAVPGLVKVVDRTEIKAADWRALPQAATSASRRQRRTRTSTSSRRCATSTPSWPTSTKRRRRAGGEDSGELRGAGGMKFAEPCRIEDYCLGIYDGPHATPTEASDGPVFLGIKNITDDGALDLSEIRHVSEEEYPRWTRRVTPQAGDVVFTYEATLHRYAIIPDGFRGCLGRRVALVRPDPDQVDSRYLLYFFLSRGRRQVVESNVVTGATVNRVPLERFPSFPVALPRLRIQQQIADILSAYDDLIENNRRRMALLDEAARQLYREWFVRFPGHEHTRITNGVPEGWERKTLDDLALITMGQSPESQILQRRR